MTEHGQSTDTLYFEPQTGLIATGGPVSSEYYNFELPTSLRPLIEAAVETAATGVSGLAYDDHADFFQTLMRAEKQLWRRRRA